MLGRVALWGAAVAVALAGFIGAAFAGSGQMLEKITPDDVVATLDELGVGYAVDIDPRGFPMITVDPSLFPAEQVNIMFFACDDVSLACDDITLWSWYQSPGAGVQGAVNAWNDPFQGDRRWSTSYLDNENDPALVLNINATGGIGTDALRIMINTYIEDMFAFEDFLQGDKVADAGEMDGSAPALTAALMDPEMVRLTSLLKDFGGDGFAHAKQSVKK